MARRARYGEIQPAPVPTTGDLPRTVGGAASEGVEAFAAGMFGLGRRLDENIATQVAEESAKVGAVAGQKTITFKPINDSTIAARAYNKAAMHTYLSELEVKSRNRIEELRVEHRGNPAGLKEAIGGYQNGVSESIVEAGMPELVPAFHQSLARTSLPYIHEAGKEAEAALRSEQEAKLFEAVDASRNAMQRLARISETNPQAAADLALERDALVQKLIAHGPAAGFEFAGNKVAPDPTRPGAVAPELMGRILREYDDTAYTSAVMGRFERAPDKRRFVEQFLKSERSNTASPVSIEQADKAAAMMRAEIHRIEADQRAQAAIYTDQVRDAIKVLEYGRTPVGIDALRRNVAGVPELSQALDMAVADKDVAREYSLLTPAEQLQVRNTMSSKKEMTGRDLHRLERFDRIHQRTVQGITSDPVTLAVDNGLIDGLPPVNLADPASLASREKVALVVRQKYGVESHGLTKDEVGEITRFISTSTPEAKTGMFVALNQGLGPNRLHVLMREVAKTQPTFALAASIAPEAPDLAKSIVRGQSVLDSGGKGAFTPSIEHYGGDVNDVLGEAFSADPNAHNAVVQSALALDAERRFLAGKIGKSEFDSGGFQRALLDVTGGIVKWNGRKVVVPVRGMSESQFDNLMDWLSDADLERAGGLPRTRNGERITAELLRKHGSLDSLGDGVYRVGIANGYAVDANGKAYELNLKALAPSILARRKPIKPASDDGDEE